MSSTAIEVPYTAPTTRPARRAGGRDQRRGPQARPDRSRLSAVVSTRAALAADATVSLAPAVQAGWRLTERGYAVMVGAAMAAAVFLATMLTVTFFSISNAPLG